MSFIEFLQLYFLHNIMFFKSGLSVKLSANMALMSIEGIMHLSDYAAGPNAIRRFSESYKSQRQNHEGELVAETLIRLLYGQSLLDIYIEDEKPDRFKRVYRIASWQSESRCNFIYNQVCAK